MTEKKFTIDVEETTQENALFEDDKFVCFEGDTDEYLKKINEMSNEIEQLKEQNQRLSEQKHIYKQDWKHLCIDKELLDSENEGLKEDNAILKHALSRIICEFDEHIAKNSEVRDLIK